MKTAAIVCLVVSILALALASWGSAGIGYSVTEISKGLSAAEEGVAKKDWQLASSGVDTVHWGHKNLYVTHAFETLGGVVAIVFSCVSLLLLIVDRRRPNQTLQPTTMSVTDRAAARSAPATVVADL